MSARLLAFDTATEQMSVGLLVDGRRFVVDAPGGQKASAALIPTLLRLLDEAGIGIGDLDAIAFGRGPGAFTGLRTACAVAQGLAFGAGKPVLAIDTLGAVAEAARLAIGDSLPGIDVWAAMDARMDEIYAARYVWRDGRWSERVAPLLIGPTALDARWCAEPPAVVAGNALTAFGGALHPGAARRVPDAMPHARALLALAEAAWQNGAGIDAAQALPLYLRDKVAQTTAERDAARQAKALA
ncbi:MAG: tRNA (adenosine(37)-N6)-threonylcarbamoyltransferase complex dimerization subunit type 1 TsaB [Burkholderiaceae bacterium]